jgi:hypothetical protein
MATQYPVKLAVTLVPVWHSEPPRVRVAVRDDVREIDLVEPTTVKFQFVSSDACGLTVEFLNKQDSDTDIKRNLDKAVIINNISFFGISDPKFVWAGIYEPIYPELWAEQQRSKGVILKNQLTAQSYMGWNGKWTLTFDVPVFSWIHKIQNLGWIYG